MRDNRREAGYYFVMFLNERTIAEFVSETGEWWIIGYGEALKETEFEEIDERPILREEK